MDTKHRCLAWTGKYPDEIHDHTLCSIANQELQNIDGTEKRGGCRRCQRSHHKGDPDTLCEENWFVCVNCYPKYCNVHMSAEPELVEAKRGEVIWL